MITMSRAAPCVLRPALAGASRIPLTQHASLTRGFTASGVSGDDTGKELAAIVAEELKMETENFETPEVRAQSATTLDHCSALGSGLSALVTFAGGFKGTTWTLLAAGGR